MHVYLLTLKPDVNERLNLYSWNYEKVAGLQNPISLEIEIEKANETSN